MWILGAFVPGCAGTLALYVDPGHLCAGVCRLQSAVKSVAGEPCPGEAPPQVAPEAQVLALWGSWVPLYRMCRLQCAVKQLQ